MRTGREDVGGTGSTELARVCAKVVAEGEFDGGETDPEEVECELGGLIMTEYLRKAAMHGWVIGVIN